MTEGDADVLPNAGHPRFFLFGTDRPICPTHWYVRFVHQLGWRDEALDALFRRSAHRFFKLPLPELSAPAPSFTTFPPPEFPRV